MTTRYYLGCITGTSVDGLDLALLRLPTNGQAHGNAIEFCAADTIPIPEPLRSELLALGQAGESEIERLGRADTALGRFIGTTINKALNSWQIASNDVAAIGSHGQTVRHRPPLPTNGGAEQNAFTLQIGDANQIAELTGITTIADFRRRDMAAGGEGAPLVPLFHQALLSSDGASRALLNIGGIANLTGIPAQGSKELPLLGFDTGPGNGLMDAWIAQHQGRAFDNDGQWAQSGRVIPDLLAKLKADPYFARPAPKSTGKEVFNLAWLTSQLGEHDSQRPEDIQATLLALTVETIADTLQALSNPYGEILVCGGGRLNSHLMLELGERLGKQGTQLGTTEALGIDGDSLEAAAFAWLACRTLAGLHGNSPSVTGAAGERVLGAIYPA